MNAPYKKSNFNQMACDLTAGISSLGCKNPGGVKTIYLANKENVTSITSSSGEVTGITMSTSTQFYEFVLPKNTGSFTENYNVSPENGSVFYEQVLTLGFRKMQAAIRNTIMILNQANLIAIVLDNAGTYWLIGETNGCEVTEGSGSTGAAMGDKNGYSLTITGQEPAAAQEVDSTIIAALLSPAL